MNCEWNGKIHALHDGELTADAREQVESHLSGCAECAAELDVLRRTARFLKAAPIPAMNPGAALRLRERVGAERIELLNGRRTARLAGWLTAAAAAVILSCGAALVSMQSRPPRAEAVAAVHAPAGEDALSILRNAVVPGSELATASESVDPLSLAVSRGDTTRDDGRE